jgi:hypothetical protein
MLLSLEEGYILPAIALLKALFSDHPIPFVCDLSLEPYRVSFRLYVGVLHHFCDFQLLSFSRVYVYSFIHRVSLCATLICFVLVSFRLPRFQLH